MTIPTNASTGVATARQRALRILRAPLAWHVASLVVGFAYVIRVQSGQWFFLDEWALLKLDGPGLF